MGATPAGDRPPTTAPPWPLLGSPVPPEVTLEAVVEQTVRGALNALAALPPGRRPATLTVSVLTVVLTEPTPRA